MTMYLDNSGTFEKLMKNRDYWRDEAKAGWAKIEALEAENEELRWAKDEATETERKELRKEIKRLQQQADERLESYAERTYQLIAAQQELEGTASKEVFDLIMGKPPEQELREITMVAKTVDDQPAHEAARPPRRWP